jgi:hypothetical protein
MQLGQRNGALGEAELAAGVGAGAVEQRGRRRRREGRERRGGKIAIEQIENAAGQRLGGGDRSWIEPRCPPAQQVGIDGDAQLAVGIENIEERTALVAERVAAQLQRVFGGEGHSASPLCQANAGGIEIP